MKWILYSCLIVLFALHNDLWLWNDASIVMGLPIGLFYHIIYCLVAALLMYALVKFAWPSHLETEEDSDAA